MSVGNQVSRKQLRITDFLSHPLLPHLFSEHQQKRHKNVYFFFNQDPCKALLELVCIGTSLHLEIRNTDVELPVWIYRCVCVQIWKVAYHGIHHCATCPQAMSCGAWIQNQNFSEKDLKVLLLCSRRGAEGEREHNTNQTKEEKQTWNWKLRKK